MLVGLDESNDSPEAVRLAAIEARLRGRPLDLVSVFRRYRRTSRSATLGGRGMRRAAG
jgi:hypothetical protein